MKCGDDNWCIVCPYRYCIDENTMYNRLIKETKYQVESLRLYFIPIWFEENDEVALRAFERYRKWLKDYGYEGNEPSYKKWIAYTEDTHKPIRDCGCHDGTFYFHKITEHSTKEDNK